MFMNESPIKEQYTSSKSLINDLIRLTRSDQYIFRGVSRRIELNPSICRKYDRETPVSYTHLDYLYTASVALSQVSYNPIAYKY